ERAPPCVLLKVRSLNPRLMPGFDTPQHVLLRVHHPHRANVPIQVFTDGLNDMQGGMVEVVGHRQGAADPMLRSQPPLGFLALDRAFLPVRPGPRTCPSARCARAPSATLVATEGTAPGAPPETARRANSARPPPRRPSASSG